MKTTISPDEVAKFSAIADEWWDVKGKFRPLHLFNPIRISYIKQLISAHFGNDFSKLTLLDVGCGGGLLSEPMARLGLNVTAIDASEKNIKTAMVHSKHQDLNIDYLCISAEQLVQQRPEDFDVLLTMEVIEHVEDPAFFLESCSHLLKPNGLMVVATLNRTFKSYAFAIVGAEYILRWLPIGTHDWNKFLKPDEIMKMTSDLPLTHHAWQGFSFNPITQYWGLTNDLNVNYAGYWVKQKL